MLFLHCLNHADVPDFGVGPCLTNHSPGALFQMRAECDEMGVVRGVDDGLMEGEVLFITEPVIGNFVLHANQCTTDQLKIFRGTPHGRQAGGGYFDIAVRDVDVQIDYVAMIATDPP